MSFLKPAKFFLALSGALVAASIVLLIVPGPLLSIDFTGGTLMELRLPETVTKEELKAAVENAPLSSNIGAFTLNKTEEGSALIRMRDLSNEDHQALLTHLTKQFETVQEQQYTTIGPTVGATLKKRAIWALILASAAIIVYLAFAFRQVPRSLSPWKFGIIAVITLVHDILITVGVFILLSHWTGFEFDTLFITALLTILGYSVNDTIVVFDRIRENLTQSSKHEDFAALVDRSLNETLTRSFNTSFSTVIMLLSLYLFGSESIQWFVLTLIVGMMVGTYSSIFLATPLLVYWRKGGKL